jgi:ABC-type polysaccharide/polyol phosphate transport system ATPase subunit
VAPAVEIVDVSKRFKLYKERYHTLKERVIFAGRDRGFDEFWAVRDVSFDVEEGKSFGLIGANGSGKSTLLKVMAGILQPTRGLVRTRGRVAALLELGAGFHPDLSGRENVYLNGSILGFSKKQMDKIFDSIVDFAELEAFIDNQVRHYSSGMYVRLGFAVAIHMDPEILFVDEVLAVGDEAFQDKCLGRIRQFQNEGRTIVLVTHAIDLVRDMCSEAALLHRGVMAAQGKPSEVARAYRDLLASDHEPSREEGEAAGTVEIQEVTLRNAEGEVTASFVAGQSMTVEVDLFAQEAVEDPVFNVNLHDNSGQHIFGTNTDWRWLSIDLDPGPARLRIDFPMLTMREGRFTLSVGIHSRDGKTIYAWRDRRTPFEVHSASDEPGRLFLPCRFDVEGASVKRALP